MSECNYICDYCGKEQIHKIYYYKQEIVCIFCKDKNLKEIKTIKDTDPFGYNSKNPKEDAWIKKK